MIGWYGKTSISFVDILVGLIETSNFSVQLDRSWVLSLIVVPNSWLSEWIELLCKFSEEFIGIKHFIMYYMFQELGVEIGMKKYWLHLLAQLQLYIWIPLGTSVFINLYLLTAKWNTVISIFYDICIFDPCTHNSISPVNILSSHVSRLSFNLISQGPNIILTTLQIFSYSSLHLHIIAFLK